MFDVTLYYFMLHYTQIKTIFHEHFSDSLGLCILNSFGFFCKLANLCSLSDEKLLDVAAALHCRNDTLLK